MKRWQHSIVSGGGGWTSDNPAPVEKYMKAVAFREVGDLEVLVDVDVPVPEPGPHDLLVAVKAVSVNPADVKVRAGSVQVPGDLKIAGYDAAGVVEAVGSNVSLFKVGDLVYYGGAIDRPGTNSEYHLVDERIVGNMPKSLSFAQAAALPLTSLTAWELLFEHLAVPSDTQKDSGTLLVINGAGGVGSILIQLARQLTGLTVVASASRPETREWVTKLGAHHIINHRNPLDVEFESLGLGDADYVAGLTNTAEQVNSIAQLIAPHGRLGVVDDYPLQIFPLMAKSISVSWEMVFTRPLFQTHDMIEQHNILNTVAKLVDEGVLVTTMKEDLGPITAENLREAHRKLESSTSIGKIVLSDFG